MKITQPQFNPIQILLETPEEVKVVLVALNRASRHEGDDFVRRHLAEMMCAEIAKRYHGNN